MAHKDNDPFQKALLAASKPGTLILTPGGRLARRLKHRFRTSEITRGQQGWVPPDVLTLNAWAWKAWNTTWPLSRPLSELSCLALWKEALNLVPPPEPFQPDLALCQTLNETYTVLVRHGLPTEGPAAALSPLVSWRRAVTGRFEAFAEEQKAFHPARLPVHLSQAVRDGRAPLPAAIILAGFESPAPVEEALFKCLDTACSMTRFQLPVGKAENLEGVVLPSRESEVAWLAQQLVMDAQTLPLNRIGVVVPETEKYVPLIERALRDVIGESSDSTTASYNISVGTPLLERSLVQAGLLPLRFWTEGEPRALLLSMILSPYYSVWSRGRDRMARADKVWRSHNLDQGLDALFQALAHEDPELFRQFDDGPASFQQSIETFVQKQVQTGDRWVHLLEQFWSGAGFPVISDEADTGAWNHLRALLYGLKEDLKETEMSLGELGALLRYLLSQEQVHVHGSEEAGLQILGLIESRGLSFEKLYVLGLSAGSLPRPVRPLPLLDALERPLVQGATVESQFTFAREAFSHLLACAPHTTLMRPEEESAEPLAPSPFFAEAVNRESKPVMDVWNAPDPVWSRAAWLQLAKKGLKNRSDFPPSDPPLEAHQLPDAVSVARLATAFACPFRFFVETVFKLAPLDELILGVSPRDRGNALHRVLALFTGRSRRAGETGSAPGGDAMEATLMACVDEVLSTHGKAKNPAHRHGWIMERRRWVGDKGDSSGLLKIWLTLEQERLAAGWQWLSEESSFDGLTFPDWPFSVTGRVDRIDGHEEEGVTLWDYKSGSHPAARAVIEGLIDPQLPAYMEAAIAKRIGGIEKALGTGATMSAGYITLKRSSSVAHKVVEPKGEDWQQVLVRWRGAVARLGQILVSGNLEAMPFPVSDGGDPQKACRFCPYGPLCGRKETD